MSTITMVCLANSRRPGGHCVAGKLFANDRLGRWIRPVSQYGGIADADARFQNGLYPKPLDIISVTLLKPNPIYHQVENFVNNKTYYWDHKGVVDKLFLCDYMDTPPTLWLNGHGYKNDRVPEELAHSLDGSLYLIRPTRFAVVVMNFMGKISVKSDLTYNGTNYCLSITDPIIETEYKAKPAGEYPLNDVICCISLSESFKGQCYKLVASII